MKKVGLLGGTFNPLHIGHLMMANEAFHILGLDEVRFMPNAIPPHKQFDGVATNEQRIAMVEQAIADIPYFYIELIEFERTGKSYTFDTIELLRQREPDVAFYFIIGGDMIDSLHTWHRIDELVQSVQFVGVKRPNMKNDTIYPVLMIDTPEIYLSSSFIRQRLATNGTVRFLLPQSVETYIRKEGLYGATTIT